MFVLFVTLILVIALSATVGWSIFTFQRSSEITSLAQRNASRMEGMAALMRASLKYDAANSTFMSPIGNAFEGSVQNPDGTAKKLTRQGLPIGIVGDDHSPWGGRYAYCPASSVGSSSDPTTQIPGDLVTAADGTQSDQTYTVSYRDLIDDRGTPTSYVSGMAWANGPALANPDIAGFIVSPVPFKSGFADIPNCSDIRPSSGNPGLYLISGASGSPQGSVAVVSGAGIVKTQTLTQSNSPVIYVSPSASNLGNGSDTGNAMSLDSALAYWHETYPTGTTFVLGAGAYALSDQDLNMALPAFGVAAPDVAGARSYVAFRGPDSGTATLSSSGGKGYMYLGVNAQFSGNVSLGSGIKLMVMPGVSVSARVSGSLGDVIVTNGDFATTATALGTLTLAGARSSATLESPSGTKQSVNVAGLVVSGGSLTLESVDAKLSGVPSVDPSSTAPRISLAYGSTISSGGTTYAAASAFLDSLLTTTVSATNCPTDPNTGDVFCKATCPAAYPYPISADCLVDPTETAPTLAGFGPSPVLGPPTGRYCRWHPALVQTASVGGATQTSVSGTMNMLCSAVTR